MIAVSKRIFEDRESKVKSYCHSFPNVFIKAKDSKLYAEDETEYIDFWAGAGALNYGHNNDYIKERILKYISSDGITHGLDLYTSAKQEFIETFCEKILYTNNLDYKIQFCGSTGTNAIEAALKLARKVKGRQGIFSFMGGYHGMSLGSLSITSSVDIKMSAGIPVPGISFLPFPHSFMDSFDTIDYIENLLLDDHSGTEKPAAIVLETVQAEGGVIVAPAKWLIRLANLCKKYDILLICDDVQVGCGRTGPFFSFQRAGIQPDIVAISKSISGYGLPMSILLLKPELDVWAPGEHNGTFRGNQIAFVGAKAAIELREQMNLEYIVYKKQNYIEKFLNEHIKPLHKDIDIRGIGMIWGIDFNKIGIDNIATMVSRSCFQKGLLIECSGRKHNVLKILPPLTISIEEMEIGCHIIKDCITEISSNLL